MKQRDLDKLQAAGYNFLRIDWELLRIKIKSGQQSYRTLEKDFGSRTAVMVRFEELMQHPKNLEI